MLTLNGFRSDIPKAALRTVIDCLFLFQYHLLRNRNQFHTWCMSLKRQFLKDQEFQQRKWNLHNVLLAFFQPFNGIQIIIFYKCPKFFMQFDNGVEFSLSIEPVTKTFKEFYHWFVGWKSKCLSTLSLTWNNFLCQKVLFTFLVVNSIASHQIYA